MKEKYTKVSQSNDVLTEENKQLKEMLALNGIPYSGSLPGLDPASEFSGSEGFGPVSHGTYQSASSNYSVASSQPAVQQRHASTVSDGAVDTEQMGIDFVLTYGGSSSAYPPLPPH